MTRKTYNETPLTRPCADLLWDLKHGRRLRRWREWNTGRAHWYVELPTGDTSDVDGRAAATLLRRGLLAVDCRQIERDERKPSYCAPLSAIPFRLTPKAHHLSD